MLEKYDIMPLGKTRSKLVPKHKLPFNLTFKTNHNEGNKRYDWLISKSIKQPITSLVELTSIGL